VRFSRVEGRGPHLRPFLLAHHKHLAGARPHLTNDYLTNDYLTNDYLTNDYLTNDYLTNDYLTNDYLTNDFGWARVHPDYRRNGIGAHLAQWLEARATMSIPKAPAGARVVLLQETLAHDEVAQALLRAQGYQLVRYFFRMAIELDGPPPDPVVPEGITIRPFIRGQEERAVIQAMGAAFKDHWGYVERPFEETFKQWMHWIDTDPDYDPSLWFIAMDGDQIAGLSLCSPKITEDPDMGWVGTLGVLRPWRRRGLALALLHHSFGAFYRRGKARVGLGVDAGSLTGALRLYERAGMRPVREFASFERSCAPALI
jgi:mycothiol synthase